MLDDCICYECKHYEANEGDCYPETRLMGSDCEFFIDRNEEKGGNKMKNLEGIQVGDKVWSPRYGWGVVEGIGENIRETQDFPIDVSFNFESNEGGFFHSSYTPSGKEYKVEICPTLFFDIPDYKNNIYPKRPRWRAKNGKEYYYVNSMGEISVTEEDNGTIDENRFKFNNYFQTKEEVMESNIYKAFHEYDEENEGE